MPAVSDNPMAGSPQPETGGYGSKENRKGLSFRTRVGDAQDSATRSVTEQILTTVLCLSPDFPLQAL